MKTLKLSLLCVTLLLAGCSMIDLAYNNAPTLVSGELEDVLDLDSGQIDQLDQRLDRFFVWHREQELVRYKDLLDRAVLAADDGIDANEFMELNRGIRLAWQRSVEKAIDSLGDLALTLTPEQIDAFDLYYQESSERFVDYLEKSEQQREIYRVDRSMKRLENWFGDFDDLLEARIRTRLQQLPDMYQPWMRYREQRHAAVMDLLNGAADNGLTSAQLKAVLLDPSTDYAREFEPARLGFWQAFAEAFEDINSWLDESHRKRMLSRLQNYARTVERLSASG